MIGAEALVPPNTAQPLPPNVRNTATPVAGSATADTSATVLRGHPGSCCHGGFGDCAEQPEPAPFHAVSLQPRGLLALTSRIVQSGQTAEPRSTSSEISPAQPASGLGSGLAAPFWFTLRKQPLAVVQAGRPNCDRYVARSDSALGSSMASTMATV